MFSKDGLKKLAEQAQKAGNRLATNAGGTTNTWFAGQISPEKGDGLEGLSELPPEQAVVKLQRQNARLRRKAEAAMALEQENATLKSQLHDMASQMATKVADEMADESTKAGTSSPDKAEKLLEAKVKMLRANLITARQELEESAGLKQELEKLHAQLKAAGIEATTSPVSTSPSSASELPTSTKPADIALTPDADDQEEPSPGQVSPSQISPFQSIAMQEPGLSWMQSSAQSAEGFSQSEGLQSGLLSSQASVLHNASVVSQLQQQNAALKAELAQLTQREAAEEADVTGLQTQNRTLIGEVERLRVQVGEARHKLADNKVAASTAEKQQKELEARLDQSRAEAANLKVQHSEAQQSHEDELQSLRHTMQLVSEHMRTAQKEFDSNLKASAAKLSALKADSEQRTEELARQLGESDFALRQLRGQLETAISNSSHQQESSQEEQPLGQDGDELEAVTQALDVLKAQHEQSLLRHKSSVSEFDDSLKQHNAENLQLKEDMAALQTQLAKTEQQLVHSKEAADKSEKELQAKTTAADEVESMLKTQLHELQEQLQAQPTTFSDVDLATERELQAESAHLEQEVSDLKTQLDQSRQQVQQAKDALSEARHDAQKSRDALTTCQLLLAEASSGQQELQSQCSDLQLQAEESAAQSSSSQSALEVSQDKLAASESELAQTRSHVEELKQQLENLQQEVISSQTAQQQVAAQLIEALKDKSMLENQMEASFSLLGQTGGNGGTGQPVPRNMKGKKKKKKLLQKSSSDVDQGSQATPSKGNGDAESADSDLMALVEDTAPDRPPAEDALPGSGKADKKQASPLAALQDAESQLKEALKGRAEAESRLSEVLKGSSEYKDHLAEASAAQQQLKVQLTDAKNATVDAQQPARSAQTQLAKLEQDLIQVKAQSASLEQSAVKAREGAAQQLADSTASKAELEQQLQDAIKRCTEAEAQLNDSLAGNEKQQEQSRQAQTGQVFGHTQQLTNASVAKDVLDQQLQEARLQASQAQQSLEEATSSQAKLEQQLREARSDLLQAQQQLKKAVAMQTETSQTLSKLQEEQSQWQDQQASQTAARNDTEQQLAGLKEQEHDWRQEREALSTQQNQLKQQVVALEEQEAIWQHERQALVTEQDKVKQQLSALQSQEANWQEERQSLRERCERLQKSNQQRRTQLLEAQQAAAHTDKVHSQLAASESSLSSLKAELSKAEAQAKEVSSLQQALEQAEQGKRALVQDWQREQAALERQLQAAGKNRDQLAEQVAMLSPVAATNEALHAQLNDLRRDLQQAQASAALLPQEAARADEAQARCCRLEADAATTSGQTSRMEDRLRSTEQKLLEAQDTIADAKQAHAELARSYQDEMEGLASKAPSAWPSHVRQLVESRERAAASSAEAAAHAEAETVEAEFEAEAERLRQTAAECRSTKEKAHAQMIAAQSRVAAIGVELEQQESSLRQQLQAHQASSATEMSKLKAEVARLMHELDISMSQARSDSSEWQDKWQHAVKELADVKERAWTLLEEKDVQLQALKAGRPPSAGRSTTSKASSHASFSRRSSASGTNPPGPPASQGNTSEIQPTRSVSEDSDSEGGTLFQPVQFSEHVQGAAPRQAPAEMPARKAGAEAAGAVASEALKDDTALLRQRVAMLEQELADSEHTHQLRDKAAEVLKEEVAMLHRSDARGSVDVNYVKNVLLNGFESGELSSNSSLVPVLSRLLHFSPAEIQRVKQAKPASLTRTMSRTLLTRLTSQ